MTPAGYRESTGIGLPRPPKRDGRGMKTESHGDSVEHVGWAAHSRDGIENRADSWRMSRTIQTEVGGLSQQNRTTGLAHKQSSHKACAESMVGSTVSAREDGLSAKVREVDAQLSSR